MLRSSLSGSELRVWKIVTEDRTKVVGSSRRGPIGELGGGGDAKERVLCIEVGMVRLRVDGASVFDMIDEPLFEAA